MKPNLNSFNIFTNPMRLFYTSLFMFFFVIASSQAIDVSTYHQQYQLPIFKKASAIQLMANLMNQRGKQRM